MGGQHAVIHQEVISGGSGRIHMAGYEAPSITELGSVADFTRAEWFASGHDGSLWFLEPILGVTS
jgi:hypothetical protein